MASIFTTKIFEFPYLYKFPGMSTDERILYITREADTMLYLRQVVVVVAGALIFLTGGATGQLIDSFFTTNLRWIFESVAAVFALIFLLVGFWWVSILWKKSIAVITNKRLIKFVYTTPWNRHELSLPLDMVVDTGAYSKGFVQALFKLGVFTARSSASSSGVATDDPGRVNKKYFYIENVTNFQDIHHYLSKVLFVFRQDWKSLANFRPFLPHLKGEARKEFMKQYPEYWS